MRILIIHNHYQDPGGEDAVFEQEKALLANTETVFSLTFRNKKGWKGLWQTALSPWNIFAGNKLKKAIRSSRPDIIHIHNLHYAIGPIAVRIAKKNRIPIVMTLHNYRLLCPSATLFHDGQLFTDSLHRPFPWKAVRYGVHSHSVIKTCWLAFTTWLHRKTGTWKQVNRYIALTDFAKRLFLHSSLGLRENQIMVKQNFIADPDSPAAERKTHFLFIGRLTTEKGINVLLDAFSQTDASLRIAGDGPLKEAVLLAAQKNHRISYLGMMDQHAVVTQLAECTALIFPSIWYEGMPMTIIEAFALGTPVIASNLGAMQSMVVHKENGLLFDAANAADLADTVNQWQHMNTENQANIGRNARAHYEKYYTAGMNKKLLLDIYHSVIHP